MQLAAPTSGEITLLNRKVAGEDQELRRSIGYLPFEISLYKELTGKQAIEFAARAYGLDGGTLPPRNMRNCSNGT